jgi:uncharacterized protein YbaP (TraB family)
MKRNSLPALSLWAVALLTACGGQASTDTAQAASKDKVDPDGQSLLWRIEGNGLDRPSYVFGTMHAIPAERFKMWKRLEELAAESNVIVMELDLDDINPMLMAGKGLMPGGKRLMDVMEPDDYARVKQVMIDSLKTTTLEWMAYDMMKPLFVISGLVKAVMGDIKGYEDELMTIAKKHEITIEGLETLEEQLAILDTIPIERQAEMLVEALGALDSVRWVLDRLIDMYEAEELDSIEALMHEDTYGDFLEFEDPLLSDRNKRWVDQMPNWMTKGQTLFAVGAGHLPGEEGLLSLLRSAGYNVTPILTE